MLYAPRASSSANTLSMTGTMPCDDITLRRRGQAPAGKLRITAPVSFGTEALTPALAAYLDRYPDVSVDLVLSDRVVDLVEEGFEAAIRIGQLPDSGLIA